MISNNLIPIKFKDKQIIIDCVIYGINNTNFRSISLVLDTGATISGISENIAVELGYDPSQLDHFEEFATAGGTQELPMITVSQIDIAGSRYKDFTLLCNRYFDENYIDGVLGLDFLINYDILINFTDGYIQITKRKDYIITP